MKAVVTYAKLHTTLFVPGFGNVEATLPPKGKTLIDLHMIGNSAGVECTFKDAKGGKHRAFVPWGTVQSAVLGDDIVESSGDETAKPSVEVKKSAVKPKSEATGKSDAAA